MNINKKIAIENARNHCRRCGYDISEIQEKINEERDWLCFQCYVDRDSPKSKENWEEKFDKEFRIPKGWFADKDLDAASTGRFFTNPELPEKVIDFIRQNFVSKEKIERMIGKIGFKEDKIQHLKELSRKRIKPVKVNFYIKKDSNV